MALILEQLGRGLVPEPVIASAVLGGGLLSALGTEAQRDAFLTPMIEGQTSLAFAYAEKMHEGQTRHSGEPYYTHPVAVAAILISLGVVPVAITRVTELGPAPWGDVVVANSTAQASGVCGELGAASAGACFACAAFLAATRFMAASMAAFLGSVVPLGLASSASFFLRSLALRSAARASRTWPRAWRAAS